MPDGALTILALSAFHGGPRQTFLEGLAAHSRHQVTQLALPPRTWPWRLKGSALHFASEIARLRRRQFNLILIDDLVEAARLRALLPPHLRATPIVQYFHDDVLSLDLTGRPRDEPLALAQLYSLLAADRACAASAFHRAQLLAGARRLIATFPDAVPVNLLETIERRLEVLPPGVDAAAIQSAQPRLKPKGPPVILWNHPWSDEQNPRMFFDALDHLDQDGLPFRVIIIGAAVRKYPDVFNEARARLAGHIMQFGYVPGREQYLATIRAADIVVSTAAREWFPLGVVEGTIAGAYPLVGRGLANAEVFGDALAAHGYRTEVELRRKLARLLANPEELRSPPPVQQTFASRYAWAAAVRQYDEVLATAAAGRA